MRKSLITLLAVGMALAAVPVVTADETKAECESGQPWIGYQTTNDARNAYYGLLAPSDPRVSGACEGEHWDGQDNVNSANNPGTEPNCATSTSTSGGVSVARCMDADPNAGKATPTGYPLALRISGAAGPGGAQAYVAVNVASGFRTAAYQGACVQGGSMEGIPCAGAASTRTAWYGRDNTGDTAGQDVLAKVISDTGITKGTVSEADCDQASYAEGARTGNKGMCGRDNTAITVETLLP